MSKVTELASSPITATDTITVELIEADETPAVVIIRWPAKPSVLTPQRFPEVAATLARLAATASTQLAAIKARRFSGSSLGLRPYIQRALQSLTRRVNKGTRKGQALLCHGPYLSYLIAVS